MRAAWPVAGGQCRGPETLQRLGPRAAGQGHHLFDAGGGPQRHSLLRPFITKDGYWRLPVTVDDVDRRFLASSSPMRTSASARITASIRWRCCAPRGRRSRNGRIVSGGSTLTMQVARLLEPRPARRFSDKLAEMVRAVQLERQLSKDEILNLYLTLAPYGGNIEGIARRRRSPISARSRSGCRPPKRALLVALPQAPESRRPDRRPEAAVAARNRVIAQAGRRRRSSMRTRPQPRGSRRRPGPPRLPHARRPRG